MLNSTLSATERTLCCIVENYAREDGIEVPKALRPFMMGIEKIPYVNVKAKWSHSLFSSKIIKTHFQWLSWDPPRKLITS